MNYSWNFFYHLSLNTLTNEFPFFPIKKFFVANIFSSELKKNIRILRSKVEMFLSGFIKLCCVRIKQNLIGVTAFEKKYPPDFVTLEEKGKIKSFYESWKALDPNNKWMTFLKIFMDFWKVKKKKINVQVWILEIAYRFHTFRYRSFPWIENSHN